MLEHDKKDQTDMRLPRGFEVNYFDDYMQITRTWFGFKTFGLLIGTLVF